MEDRPTEDVVESVNRELNLIKSCPVYQAGQFREVRRLATSGPHDGVTRESPKQMRARFVARRLAPSLDANVYSPSPGLEVTRGLVDVALPERPHHSAR